MRLRSDEIIETPIASLIDIVFLLIIFFVVTSAIDREELDASVKLAESQFIKPVTKRDPRTVTINLKQSSSNEIEINVGSVPLSLATLGSVLGKTSKRYGTDLPVVIRADGGIQYRDIDEIMTVVGEAGISRIRFASRDIGRH